MVQEEVMQSYISIGFSASDSIGKIQILEIQICSNYHLTMWLSVHLGIHNTAIIGKSHVTFNIF